MMMEKKNNKTFRTEVNPVFCKACGYCREVCPVQVFEPSDQLNIHGYNNMVAVHSKKCNGCLKCVMICPDFAISVEELTSYLQC